MEDYAVLSATRQKTLDAARGWLGLVSDNGLKSVVYAGSETATGFLCMETFAGIAAEAREAEL